MALIIEGEAAHEGVITYPTWAWGLPVILDEGTLASGLSTGPTVEFLVAHGFQGGLPLAATDAERAPLALSEEAGTLYYEASMIEDHADAVQAWQKVDAGLMTEASLGYYLLDFRWERHDGQDVVLAREISFDEGDVSIVRYGGDRSADATARTEATAGRPRRKAWHPRTYGLSSRRR